MKPGKYICCYQCSNLWLYARKVEPLIQQIETRINLPLLQLVRMANAQRQALKIARNSVALWHGASFYLILLTADIRWRLLTGLKMTLNQGMKSFSYLNKNCSVKQNEYLKTRKICFFFRYISKKTEVILITLLKIIMSSSSRVKKSRRFVRN